MPTAVTQIDPGLLADLGVEHAVDVPIGPMTWFKVGGRAAILARPADAEQLGAVIARCREQHAPVYVLGSGANLLVTEAGVPGVVVRLDAPGFSEVKVDGATVTAGAGADLFKLVGHTARLGLAGLERVAGIPASIGGAVRMNAGGSFGDIGTSVAAVTVMDGEGHVRRLDRDELHFDYRRSDIVEPFILEVEFELMEAPAEDVMRRVKEVFFYKKTTQPMGAKSAGCAFKNPPKEIGAAAGQLIDRAGLKGFRVGGATVSDLHANFITVDPATGRADDVKAVMDHVQQTVADKFDVTLEREVVVWP